MRRTYSGDETLLMACSICGFPFEFPTQGRLCVDKLFRCNQFCGETETPLDYERKTNQARRVKEPPPGRFPAGIKPSWHE